MGAEKLRQLIDDYKVLSRYTDTGMLDNDKHGESGIPIAIGMSGFDRAAE